MAEERKKKFKTKVKSSQAISSETNSSMDELLIASVKNTTNGSIKINIKKVKGEFTKKDIVSEGKISEEQLKIAEGIKSQALKALDGVTDGYFKVGFKTEFEQI